MIKLEKEYNEKYSSIPIDFDERMQYLLKKTKLTLDTEKVSKVINEIKNIKWNKIEYTIYLLPKATPRPRSGKNGVFYVKGAKDNKKFFKKFIEDKNMNNVEKICAELGIIRPTSKPDWDNVAKAYCDMIQGILIYDDSLIVEGNSRKFYSLKPRIEIKIEYMEDYDSKFNKRKIKK